MVARTHTVRKGPRPSSVRAEWFRDYDDVTIQVIRRCQGTASGAGGLSKGRRVALSCHKGLGILGRGTGRDTVEALRHLSIVLSTKRSK